MKEVSHAFQILKPVCIDLAKTFSSEGLNQLQKGCEDLDPACFQLLQEYLIFPIRLSLKREKKENVLTECIKFSCYVFQKTKISWNLFHDYIQQIFSFISEPLAHKTNLQAHSEELRISICNCTEIMLINNPEIRENIYNQDFCLELAQYIFTLLDLLKKETSKLLRMSALKALSAFLYVHNSIAKLPDIIVKAGDRLAAFLPGISIALKDIICGDVKQGHAIFSSTLKIFGDFLVLLVGDDTFNDKKQVEDSQDSRIPRVVRNSSWLNNITDKMEIIVRKTCEITSHEHWEVRKELADFATKLLCHCSKNLPNCISPLLQVLFILNVDKYEQVAISSRNGIKTFSESKATIKSFSSILEEDIFVITSKLIKIHLSTNDVQKLELLKTLQGCFELLGSSINNLLYSLPHLDRFMVSLLNLVKFDYSDSNYFSQRLPIMTLNCESQTQWPKLTFKYFDEEEIVIRIYNICSLLGHYGDLHLLIDYLLAKSNSSYSNESLFLINCIIKSLNSSEVPVVECPNKNTDSHVAVTNIILKSLLTTDVWSFPFSADSSSTSDDFKENVLQMCLTLEAIALSSQILKKEFCIYLMEVLCLVMEKAGCSNSIISHTSNLTLFNVSISCGYESVANLIIENADYLVNSITLNFYHFQHQSESIVVLQVIVQYCDKNILPLIKDIILEMLKMMDLHQEKALAVMKVLKSVVTAIKRWFSGDTIQETSSPIEHSSKNKIANAILKRHHLKQQEAALLQEETNCDFSSSELEDTMNNDETEEKEPPLYVGIITEILGRCVHMLSTNHLQLIILTLEIVDVCLVALKNYNDQLLPYVHKLWSPLVCQFSSNTIILRKAFETLLVIAEECGDFVKSRTMKDVWPKLLAFLKSQLTVSTSKRNSSDFSVSANYKLLLLLLSKIGYLASKLELTEKEFEVLLSHCLPYLDKNQPDSLQEATAQTLKYFSLVDSDSLWFHYNVMFGCENDFHPQHSDLKTVRFPKVTDLKPKSDIICMMDLRLS